MLFLVFSIDYIYSVALVATVGNHGSRLTPLIIHVKSSSSVSTVSNITMPPGRGGCHGNKAKADKKWSENDSKYK